LNVLAEQKNLAQIFAANNKIDKIASIMELKSLPNLVEVDFSENPVSENT
jgi:Leucine-rich repeat (LRR) protein